MSTFHRFFSLFFRRYSSLYLFTTRSLISVTFQANLYHSLGHAICNLSPKTAALTGSNNMSIDGLLSCVSKDEMTCSQRLFGNMVVSLFKTPWFTHNCNQIFKCLFSLFVNNLHTQKPYSFENFQFALEYQAPTGR